MLGPTDITVVVHQAKDLLIKGKGSNDAYATMEFGSEKFATNVIAKALAPAWHQECNFKLPSGGVLNKMNVTISVFNKQHGKFGLQNDDFIGQIKIPLSSFNTESSKESSKWYKLEHKNPKKEKKPRGDIEVGIKFTSKERFSILPDKKTPKSFGNLTSNIKQKLRRRSEDEDSGVGIDNYPMKKGYSMDNLTRTPSSASDTPTRKRLSLADVRPIASTRGLVKLSNKIGLSGHKTKATSVEVLNNPEFMRRQSGSTLQRSSSGGRSDSGNNSLNTSQENLPVRSSSTENIRSSVESTADLHASHNDNFSNSKRSSPFSEKQSLSILYKPKSYYRLDVKELCKVSTIPEDPSVTFQQLDRDELLKLCINQHHTIANQKHQLRELEDYIDSLLVKVMVATPHILDRQHSYKGRKTKF